MEEGKPVDLVLSCVDNFEARMAINKVCAPVTRKKYTGVCDTLAGCNPFVVWFSGLQ